MARLILYVLIFTCSLVEGMEPLDTKYCVSFGEKEAPMKAVVYFSFSCPHCRSFFCDVFPQVKRELVDTGKLQILFHPVPMDIVSVWSILCFEQMNTLQKQVFLLSIVPEADASQQEYSRLLVKRVMDFYGKTCPWLEKVDVMADTQGFRDAYQFISQDDAIKEVPLVMINEERLYGVPSLEDFRVRSQL